jgi:hypothetical protein
MSPSPRPRLEMTRQAHGRPQSRRRRRRLRQWGRDGWTGLIGEQHEAILSKVGKAIGT